MRVSSCFLEEMLRDDWIGLQRAGKTYTVQPTTRLRFAQLSRMLAEPEESEDVQSKAIIYPYPVIKFPLWGVQRPAGRGHLLSLTKRLQTIERVAVLNPRVKFGEGRLQLTRAGDDTYPIEIHRCICVENCSTSTSYRR